MTTLWVDGVALPAGAEDSVASAMIAAGQRTCRTTRSGEPRGMFCGSGVCGECFMIVDGVPGTPTCRTPVRDGMVVQRQTPRPTLPQEADSSRSRSEPTDIELSPDVLVVGAGPAGMAAAATMAESGLQVLVVDDNADPGGQFFARPASDNQLSASRDARARAGDTLVSRLRDSGAEILPGTRVWGASAADVVFAAGPAARYVIRPRRLVLATGGYGRAEPFPGWNLPGVMTAAGAGRMLRVSGRAAGRRILIAGTGPGNVVLANDLARAGATVIGVAELAPAHRPAHLTRLVAAAARSAGAQRYGGPLAGWSGARLRLGVGRIPVWASTTLVSCHGESAVQSARLARLDASGRLVLRGTRDVEVDAVCVGRGIAPSTELAAALGCEVRLGPAGTSLVVRDAAGRTSVPGVRAVGDGAEFAGAALSMAAGHRCGAALVRELRTGQEKSNRAPTYPTDADHSPRTRRHLRRLERTERVLAELYPQTTTDLSTLDPNTVICRCENVTLAQLTEGLAGGIGSAGSLKRVTRAGMGPCQGRFCADSITRLAAAVTGVAPNPRSGFRPQLPSTPTRLGSIAAPEPTSPSG